MPAEQHQFTVPSGGTAAPKSQKTLSWDTMPRLPHQESTMQKQVGKDLSVEESHQKKKKKNCIHINFGVNATNIQFLCDIHFLLYNDYSKPNFTWNTHLCQPCQLVLQNIQTAPQQKSKIPPIVSWVWH